MNCVTQTHACHSAIASCIPLTAWRRSLTGVRNTHFYQEHPAIVLGCTAGRFAFAKLIHTAQLLGLRPKRFLEEVVIGKRSARPAPLFIPFYIHCRHLNTAENERKGDTLMVEKFIYLFAPFCLSMAFKGSRFEMPGLARSAQ